MNPPRRLSEEGADAFEAALLRSARNDGATASRARTLAALAAVAAGTGTAGVAMAKSVPGALSKAAIPLATAKVLAVVVAVGFVGAGGAWLILAPRERSAAVPGAAPAPALNLAPSPPVPVQPPPLASPPLPLGDAPLAPVEPAVLPARLSRPPLKRRPASDDSLMAEAALVDRARLQLWRRDGEGARQTADSYLARFPHGRLAAEAQVIRVHAALLTGGPTAAAPLARAFLRLYPDSPHAPAMRRVLTE